MSFLKTHTLATQERNTFLVYWSGSTNRTGGLVKVWAEIQAQAISRICHASRPVSRTISLEGKL
ncbi:hypothetical protein GALL_194780 [mine drainage metagenome]|uniref:Uncharacterized protein n=1 Tax=mine drainage metagenome TaxID=410659 RepID=A0A1J5S2X5_9ZZZZ